MLVCVSSVFFAHKANNPRVVHDCKHMNGFTEAASREYETFPDLA